MKKTRNYNEVYKLRGLEPHEHIMVEVRIYKWSFPEWVISSVHQKFTQKWAVEQLFDTFLQNCIAELDINDTDFPFGHNQGYKIYNKKEAERMLYELKLKGIFNSLEYENLSGMIELMQDYKAFCFTKEVNGQIHIVDYCILDYNYNFDIITPMHFNINLFKMEYRIFAEIKNPD